MIRAAVLAVWAMAVALGSAYASYFWTKNAHFAPPAEVSAEFDDIEIKRLIVPIIADGVIAGYGVASFSVVYKRDSGPDSGSMDSLARDIAYKVLSSGAEVDLYRAKKGYAERFTTAMAERLNLRLGEGQVKEVLVSELQFMSARQAVR